MLHYFHQLDDNFVCLRFGAEQLLYGGFIKVGAGFPSSPCDSNQQHSIFQKLIQEKVLLGAEFNACARETVAPRQSFVFSLAAEHSVLVLLRGDVLLPLSLTVTVLTTQMAVEATLKYGKKEAS